MQLLMPLSHKQEDQAQRCHGRLEQAGRHSCLARLLPSSRCSLHNNSNDLLRFEMSMSAEPLLLSLAVRWFVAAEFDFRMQAVPVASFEGCTQGLALSHAFSLLESMKGCLTSFQSACIFRSRLPNMESGLSPRLETIEPLTARFQDLSHLASAQVGREEFCKIWRCCVHAILGRCPRTSVNRKRTRKHHYYWSA